MRKLLMEHVNNDTTEQVEVKETFLGKTVCKFISLACRAFGINYVLRDVDCSHVCAHTAAINLSQVVPVWIKIMDLS